MNRRTFLFGTGTLTTVALAGCTGSAQEAESSSSDTERTITVSESGEIEAESDLAVLRASVEATGESAETVRDELAERSDDLYDELVAYGIPEENITTGDFSIRDQVDDRQIEQDGVELQSEEDLQEYIYYEGSHSLTVEIEDIEHVGEVVDTAVDAGADDIGRIEFTLSDETEDELRETALGAAIADARSEAEFVATEVDATVVEAKTVDTSGGEVSPVREDVEMDDTDDAGGDPSTEIHPDEVTVTATVDITYTVR